VATTTYQDSADAKYPVADVLVIELYADTTRDFVFGVQKYGETVEAILSDGTIGTVATGTFSDDDFYDTKNGTINSENTLWKSYVTAANIYEIEKLDYIDVLSYDGKGNKQDPEKKEVTTLDYDTTLPVYTITKRGDKLSATNVGVSALKEKQNIIIVWANTRQTEVSYIIIVDESDASLKTIFNGIADTTAAAKNAELVAEQERVQKLYDDYIDSIAKWWPAGADDAAKTAAADVINKMSLADLEKITTVDTTNNIWTAAVDAVAEVRIDAAIAKLGTVTIYEYGAKTNVKTAVEKELASVIKDTNLTVDVTVPSFAGPTSGQADIEVTVAVTYNGGSNVSKNATVDVVLTTAAK
jgi:hypothetical protein